MLTCTCVQTRMHMDRDMCIYLMNVCMQNMTVYIPFSYVVQFARWLH